MDLNPDLDLRKKLASGFDLDLDLSSLTGFGFDLDLQGWRICTPLIRGYSGLFYRALKKRVQRFWIQISNRPGILHSNFKKGKIRDSNLKKGKIQISTFGP